MKELEKFLDVRRAFAARDRAARPRTPEDEAEPGWRRLGAIDPRTGAWRPEDDDWERVQRCGGWVPLEFFRTRT